MNKKVRITENDLLRLRRRLRDIEHSLDNMIEFETNPCDFQDAGDFIGEMCEILVMFYNEDSPRELTPREKDATYFLFVDYFGKKLENIYNKKCGRIKESEDIKSPSEKKDKVKLFQELINEKIDFFLETCKEDNISICDALHTIDEIKVSDVRNVKLTDKTYVLIYLRIMYTSYMYVNFDDLILYYLKLILKESTGNLPIVIDYSSYNTFKHD
jgi:hypothetical protein